MPKASVKRLIECNKKQLVDLVLDIENYPKFIPYCLDAKIYEKKEERNLIFKSFPFCPCTTAGQLLSVR